MAKPKNLHGPELNCGGPALCNDCREEGYKRQKRGLELYWKEVYRSRLEFAKDTPAHTSETITKNNEKKKTTRK